jgi:hypothetical protein
MHTVPRQFHINGCSFHSKAQRHAFARIRKIMKIPTIATLALALLSGCGGGGASVPASHTINIVRTPAQLRWADADAYCRTTAFANQTGWRLPTLDELVAYAKGGTDSGGGAVWSSVPAQPTFHYYVSLNSTTGTALAAEDASYFYVRCAHD